MSLEKHKIIESLHLASNKLHDAREYLAQMPIGRNAKQMNILYEQLLDIDNHIRNILDDAWWG